MVDEIERIDLMSKWIVSEQSISDENGQQIIEASEWYMREELQKICDEHNYLEKLNSGMFSLQEIVARNLVAWDTSKDKKEGLLPEVYLHTKGLYKALTGEEYSFYKTCKKYHIGAEYS